MKLTWPAPERNKGPILDVLREVLPASGTVLEIASGSGQHAAWFATHLAVRWQPTDPDPAHRASIAAWRAEVGAPNLLPPLHLDVLDPEWPVQRADAVVNINMIHVAPWEATPALFRGAARLLAPGAPLAMYGPYLRGPDSAPSNLRFSESLRARDPAWGVRELDAVVAEAERAGFALERVVEMPANNLTVVVRRRPGLTVSSPAAGSRRGTRPGR